MTNRFACHQETTGWKTKVVGHTMCKTLPQAKTLAVKRLLECMLVKYLCVFRPAVSQPYNPGAVNLSGSHPSYPQHYGPLPTMQQVTNQMTGMQINSASTPAGPGFGKFGGVVEPHIRLYLVSFISNHTACRSLFSSTSQLSAACQYRLLSSTSSVLPPCSSSCVICPSPAPSSQRPCSFSAILRRPATSFPAVFQLFSSPYLSTAVHLFCAATPHLSANVSSFLLLRSCAPTQPPSSSHSVPATAPLPSNSASLLLSTSTCQPACLCVRPASPCPGLLPTSGTPSIFPTWIFSSSDFSALWSVPRPDAPSTAAPYIPAAPFPLRSPSSQFSGASHLHGPDQPPASRTTGPIRPLWAPAAASLSAWHAGRIPSSAEW